MAALLWTPGSGQPPQWRWLQLFERAGGDKLVHAGLFGVQAWLLCRCRDRSGFRWPAASFALAVAYGLVTEAGQVVVPGRGATAGDVAADTAGAAVGAAFASWRSRAR